MSVQSEMDRINNNVQAALRTIADTGVSVAADANSDALPAAAAALANEKQDKLTGTAGQVVGFDADGNAVAQEAPSGGGNATWAGLPDKPVVMAGKPDTLEWDGNTDGKIAASNGYLFRVSEAIPTKDDCANGITMLADLGEGEMSMPVPGEEIQYYFMDDGFASLEVMVFVPVDNYEAYGTTYPKSGVYFSNGVKALTIPGYTGFGQEKIAPSHLYQPDWDQNDASAPDFIKNRPIVMVNLSMETFALDKTAGEIAALINEGKTVLLGMSGTPMACEEDSDGVIIVSTSIVQVMGGALLVMRYDFDMDGNFAGVTSGMIEFTAM